MQKHTPANPPLSYSEILRIVGAFLDREQMQEARILETDEGLVVQGRLTQGERAGETDTYQLSLEDIEGLKRDALALRGKTTLAGAARPT